MAVKTSKLRLDAMDIADALELVERAKELAGTGVSVGVPASKLVRLLSFALQQSEAVCSIPPLVPVDERQPRSYRERAKGYNQALEEVYEIFGEDPSRPLRPRQDRDDWIEELRHELH